MLMSHQGITTSQKRSIGRHLVSHVLRGQNERSTKRQISTLRKLKYFSQGIKLL